MSYDNPTTGTYRFPAATLSSAAIIGRIEGPSGKKGRVVDVSYVVTTGVTVAANTVDIGATADVDEFATLTVPIASANAGGSGAVLVSGHEIDADELVEVSTNGECTAGAADITVVIDWY